MKYADRAEKFKEITYKENSLPNLKWRNPDELGSYLERFGGRLKDDRRRRRGYLVCVLQEGNVNFPALIAEVPNEFAEKVMAMGGFP